MRDRNHYVFPLAALCFALFVGLLAGFVDPSCDAVTESILREEALEHKRMQRACLEGGNSPSVCGVAL